jgi:hypothetical protein
MSPAEAQVGVAAGASLGEVPLFALRFMCPPSEAKFWQALNVVR